MRDIKFRAWYKYRKEMKDVLSLDFSNKKIYIEANKKGNPFGYLLFDDAELMQYTGLKDKNGKEIYEGDIVEYTFDLPGAEYASENGLKVRKGKVFWSDWRSSFAIGNSSANNDLFKYVRNGNRVKVIGNIYENPELLEDK